MSCFIFIFFVFFNYYSVSASKSDSSGDFEDEFVLINYSLDDVKSNDFRLVELKKMMGGSSCAAKGAHCLAMRSYSAFNWLKDLCDQSNSRFLFKDFIENGHDPEKESSDVDVMMASCAFNLSESDFEKGLGFKMPLSNPASSKKLEKFFYDNYRFEKSELFSLTKCCQRCQDIIAFKQKTLVRQAFFVAGSAASSVVKVASDAAGYVVIAGVNLAGSLKTSGSGVQAGFGDPYDAADSEDDSP